MKARTPYSDLTGTAAADVNSGPAADKFDFIANHLALDIRRFKIVGIKLYDLPNSSVSLICVDNDLSTAENDYIVDMSLENDNELIEVIFQNFCVVLHDKFDNRYSLINEVHEVRYSEFHDLEED